MQNQTIETWHALCQEATGPHPLGVVVRRTKRLLKWTLEGKIFLLRGAYSRIRALRRRRHKTRARAASIARAI
jgi:hypothetical protein